VQVYCRSALILRQRRVLGDLLLGLSNAIRLDGMKLVWPRFFGDSGPDTTVRAYLAPWRIGDVTGARSLIRAVGQWSFGRLGRVTH